MIMPDMKMNVMARKLNLAVFSRWIAALKLVRSAHGLNPVPGLPGALAVAPDEAAEWLHEAPGLHNSMTV